MRTEASGKAAERTDLHLLVYLEVSSSRLVVVGCDVLAGKTNGWRDCRSDPECSRGDETPSGSL